MADGGAGTARAILGAGPRATEQRLIERLRALHDAARRDPALLAHPVVVIVASGALRRHLARVVARALGPAVLGVRIQTLWSTAREILERAAEPASIDGGFFEILVRREAARHEVLARDLGALEDGYSSVAASVRDLLSAGLDEATLPAALAALPQGAQREAALLRVATGTARAMRTRGLGRPADALRRAAQLLEARGCGAFPSRAVIIHGFADATGAATALLRALLALPDATIYLDAPLDPVRKAGTPDAGNAFRERFQLRLAAEPSAPAAPSPRDGISPAKVDLFHAAGRDAEAREIAHRIRALLHPPSGTPPAAEEIGVVFRSLDGWEIPLRRWFDRLGIPFSGGDEPSGLRPLARRLAALLALVERADAAPADAWLDAGGGRIDGGNVSAHDLRLALRALGVARLADAARIDLQAVLGGRESYRLPVRTGAAVEPREERDEAELAGADEAEPTIDGPEVLAVRAREVPAGALRRALEAALEIAQRLAGRLERAPLAAHLDEARALGAELLDDDRDAALAWDRALGALGEGGASDEPLSREEFLLLFRPALEAAIRRPLGGAGGGVQLLDVARARAMTFAHLFLAGVNRDQFPRRVREDPLLTDAARRRLAEPLPHLPQKGWGGDEERFLFAQLMDAAPAVTVSWQRADDDGKALDPSPFVRRLLLERPDLGAEAVPRPRGELLERTAARAAPLTLSEHLQRAALAGDLDRLERLAALAWDDPLRARARRQALEEWDAPPGRRGLGPLSGFLPGHGEIEVLPLDALSVTIVEQVARCPWRAFLERSLHLVPPPDPRAEVPEPDPRAVGAVVHAVLERLVVIGTGGRPHALESLLEEAPVAVRRPDEARTESLTREVAREIAIALGITLPGLHEALARRALPFVRRAIELEWMKGAPQVLGTEVEGAASIATGEGEPVALCFRADRVDRGADGAIVLTDYKTGRPPSEKKKPETRRKEVRTAVAGGKLLQGAVYAAADAPGGKVGRYLALDARLDPLIAETRLDAADDAVSEDLPRAVATLLGAARVGSYFPRLEELDDPKNPACRFCDVRAACVLDDSGVRARWRRAVRSALQHVETPGGEASVDRRVAAMLAVLRLGAKRGS